MNFLSYRKSSLEFDDFIALVGPNASGKSNAVAAIKLLRDIPFHGLPIAIARRGGFDQLRHRSHGRPYDPALKLRFSYDGNESYYELALGAIDGKRYEVKHEHGVVKMGLDEYRFTNDSGKFSWTFIREGAELGVWSPRGKLAAIGIHVEQELYAMVKSVSFDHRSTGYA